MKNIKIGWRRYLSAEIYSTAGVVIGAGTTYLLTGNRILAAYVGTICETSCFYGFISFNDFRKNRMEYKKAGKRYGISSYFKTLRNIIFEFGLPEVFDSLFIRPFCLYWFPIWMRSYSVGIIAGQLAANIIFYIPAYIINKIQTRILK
jgi:hypothetical protein